MDAIDAAVVEFEERRLNVVAYEQFPIDAEIKAQIHSVNATLNITDLSRIDAILGKLFADAVNQILRIHGIDITKVAAIGSHGQTLLHLPNDKYPRTLQVGDPSIIAAHTGITTVADFRRNDIAAGGQGAPLTPGFHSWMFRSNNIDRAVLNLGGIANITVLPSEPEKELTGFDTGPGNGLMDAWSQVKQQQAFDVDGNWAATGRCNETLLEQLLTYPYFKSSPPKSTGKDEFNLQWLEGKINDCNLFIEAHDVQRTLLELSAVTISHAIKDHAPDISELLVCGGGVHNLLLMARLKELMNDIEIVSTEKYGIHPDMVEAVAFAWLAWCRLMEKPGNIPSVTGATKPVLLGAIYQA
jgi:anhydro-N-acetylmuramic acid kinase